MPLPIEAASLPNTPQDYVYLQKPGDNSSYEFPLDADIRRVFKSRVPVFIADGTERGIPHYEDLLGSEGFRLIERFPPASAWVLAVPEDLAS